MQVIVMVQRESLPRKTRDSLVSSNWAFDNFLLTEELFAKALGSFETCALVNNNLWGKLFSSLESPTMCDKNFQSYFSITFYSRF